MWWVQPLGRYRLFYQYIKCQNDTYIFQEIMHFSVCLYQYITLLACLIYFWRGVSRPQRLPGSTLVVILQLYHISSNSLPSVITVVDHWNSGVPTALLICNTGSWLVAPTRKLALVVSKTRCLLLATTAVAVVVVRCN